MSFWWAVINQKVMLRNKPKHVHTHLELHITQVCVCVCVCVCVIDSVAGISYIWPTNFVMMRIFLNEILCGIFSLSTLFRLLAGGRAITQMVSRYFYVVTEPFLVTHLPSEMSVGWSYVQCVMPAKALTLAPKAFSTST
jgi:hypothetical protein